MWPFPFFGRYIKYQTRLEILNARLLMAVRVGGGAARGSRSASAQSAPVDCSSASPPLRARDGLGRTARPSFISGDSQPAAQDASSTTRVLRVAEGHAAKRGGLGARRWADIRQAARVAYDNSVVITVHGVEVYPLISEDRKILLSSEKENDGQASRHNERRAQKSRETIGKISARELQQQERSAHRLLKFQETKRFWGSIVQRLLHRDRAKLLNSVWTDWMGSKPPPPSMPVPAHAPAAVLAPAPGMRVRITGVQARQELNGQSGTTGTFDNKKGRCAVLLPSGEWIALKPTNLEVLSKPATPTSSDAQADAWRAALEQSPLPEAENRQKSQKRKPRSRAKRP